MLTTDWGKMRKALTKVLAFALVLTLLAPALALAEELQSDNQNDPTNVATPTQMLGQNMPLAAEPVGTAKIKLESDYVSPNSYRDALQSPKYGSLAWLRLPTWSNGAAVLLNANGEQIASASGNGQIAFENLPAGTYTIRLTPLEWGTHVIFASVVNGGPMANLLTEYETTVTVADGQTLSYVAVYEPKAYGFSTTTEVGTFADGQKQKVYYEGWNRTQENKDSSTSASNPYVSSHNGIYYGDSASLYANMNDLEVPTLSAEEAAKGYMFAGWKLAGDSSGKVFSTDEALAYVVYDHVAFEAVWDIPVHTVTFATSSDYGSIDGKTTYSYERQFNNQLVDTIPVPDAKEGYEFVGWFTDLTTNVIPEDTIKATRIDRDLMYFAKYKIKSATGSADPQKKSYTVKYLGGTDGDLRGTDTLVVEAGAKIPTIPSVRAHDHATFIKEWQVISLGEGAKHIAEGDVLTEDQIARLEVNYDVIFEALYTRNYYTVVYMDGANNTAFMPMITESIEHGAQTPAFEGELERDGHEFIGWDKPIKDTVTEHVVYTAQWKPESVQAESSNPNADNTGNQDNNSGDAAGDSTAAADKTTDAAANPSDNKANANAKDTQVSNTKPAAAASVPAVVTYGTPSGVTVSTGASRTELAKTGDNTAGPLAIVAAGAVALGVGGFLGIRKRGSHKA